MRVVGAMNTSASDARTGKVRTGPPLRAEPQVQAREPRTRSSVYNVVMWIRLGLLIAGLGVVSACAKKEPPATKPPPASPVAETPAPTAPTPTPTPAPAPPTEPRSIDPQVVAGVALWGKCCALCHGASDEGYAADHA